MTQWGLDTLFNPAKRHMDDEKRRLQSTREEVGDNSGGRRVDLESGKVVIRRPENEADESDDGDDTGSAKDAKAKDAKAKDAKAKDAKAKDAKAKDAKAKDAKAKDAKAKPASAAAQRAAARRGRTAR